MSCDSASVFEETVPVVEPKSSLKRSKTKKSLRFSEKRNQIFPIPHLDNMSDDLIASIWYNSEEYSEVKSSYQMTIFRMEKGEFQEDDDHTSRGLEYRTQEGAWARYENKRDAYNAVLDEQDRQWKVDEDDFEEIGRVYLEHSTKCAIAAAERGANDAKEAKEICRDLLKKRRTNRKKSKRVEKDEEVTVPHAAKVKALLRQRSARGRELIRNDIEQQQAKVKKDKRQALVV